MLVRGKSPYPYEVTYLMPGWHNCASAGGPMSEFNSSVSSRRTFAIISTPMRVRRQSPKTAFAGFRYSGRRIKRKAGATCDIGLMAMEQERGISVTSSVMQFPYRDRVVNLLDTWSRGLSEDTYRTLTPSTLR